MKFEKLLREWQAPLRARTSNFLQIESELSLYRPAANDQGQESLRLGEEVRGTLASLEYRLATARENIPLPMLCEQYGGVDVKRALMGAIFEQVTGGAIRVSSSAACAAPEETDEYWEMYEEASYPPPGAANSRCRRLCLPVTLRCLDGRRVTSSMGVVLHFDWLRECDVRLSGDITGGLDEIEVPILGLEEELLELPKTMRFDAAGSDWQVSSVQGEERPACPAWGDEGIINAGMEIFREPSDLTLLESVVDDEAAADWVGEADTSYTRLRVWAERGEGREDLLAIGEPQVGVVYFGDGMGAFD
jgi:hypothetical protein